MNDVKFEADEIKTNHMSPSYSKYQDGLRKRGIVGFLINKNIVKNEKQANTALIVSIILCLIVAYAIYSHFSYQAPLISFDEYLRSHSLK